MNAHAVVLVLALGTLNPLVVRNATPVGNAASDCEQGLAAAPPTARVEVAQLPMPEPRPMAAAPARDLATELEAVQRALVHNDRASFDEHLEAVRRILANDESVRAAALVDVYDDAARLWDAQFVSPFFAEESELYGVVKNYPGYNEFVRRAILKDDRGQRFYPAAESRAFLANVAGERLGVPRVTASRRTTSPRRQAVKRKAPAPPPPPPPPPPAPTPAPPATTTTTTIATDTAPAPAPPPATAPILTTTTIATTTTTTEPLAPEAPEPQRRSLLLPVILILLGVGVLVLLFRTSS